MNTTPRTTTTRRVGIVAALLAALAAGVAQSADAAPQHQVPFAVSVSGTASADLAAGLIAFSGAGVGTQLGATRNTGSAQITGPDASCPGGLANTNVETFTAANGDTLTLTSTDVACPQDATGTRFAGSGHWVVTGGTGRFAHASGSGTAHGGADLAAGTFRFAFDGTVSAPAGG